MLDVAPLIGSVVRRMTPHLLLAEGTASFITSDTPVYKFDENDERRLAGLGGVGWETPEVQVSVPLTKLCCLILNWDGSPGIVETDDFGVANCNSLRAGSTWRYAFAPQGDFPILDKTGQMVWGEEKVLSLLAEHKSQQPGVVIQGGPIPRRPPLRKSR